MCINISIKDKLNDAIQKVDKTQDAMDKKATYVEALNGKVQELTDRGEILSEIEMYGLIFDSLGDLAFNLDNYVKRHSGSAIMDFETQKKKRLNRYL